MPGLQYTAVLYFRSDWRVWCPASTPHFARCSSSAGSPGSRISALAPPKPDEEEETPLPTADDPLSFEQHVKPLFRERDRNSMKFAFDLWSHDDASQHADAILERLRAGTMPCDGAWTEAKVDVFQRWTASGRQA
jgi:hypothetical protein